MKITALLSFTLLLSGMLFNGCKKEPGVIGKKVVTGIVSYKNGATGTNDPAYAAIVYVTYGASTAIGVYDQTTTTDSIGRYYIRGLQKGHYFITATFTDPHGFKYSTYGYAVTINDKKSELKLDILLE